MEINCRLYDIFPDHKEITYTYDFVYNWKHYLENIVSDYSYNYFRCLEGAGNTPPEDDGEGKWIPELFGSYF